jgi:predicted dehydrogenase
VDRDQYVGYAPSKSLPHLLTLKAEFVADLLADPASRGVSDVKHEVVAAASSNGKERATKFLTDYKCPASAKAYGSYKELVADPDVDIVYVATPHSHHYQNVRLCLDAGKHVLCEKAFTVNAEQAKILVQEARQKKLFLMEAVWTRYFPICKELRELVRNGKIGTVHRVFADLSFWKDVEKEFGTSHRMVNLDLAGGAMLDCKPNKAPFSS